jgi:hypothetical protein
MNAPDDEFDDFLKRRKPLFGRPADDDFDPPEALDRIVLRQAREAIASEKPLRVFRAPRWGAPLALAATVLLTFSFFFHTSVPSRAPVPEVTVQAVAQQMDVPEAAAPAPAELARGDLREESAASENSVMVDIGETRAAKIDQSAPALKRRARDERVADVAQPAQVDSAAADKGFVSEAEADRYAASPPPPAAPSAAGYSAGNVRSMSTDATGGAPVAAAKATAEVPAFRRDSKTWLAEIERLRSEGNVARAEEELAEYKRQHRAYAVAPDR